MRPTDIIKLRGDKKFAPKVLKYDEFLALKEELDKREYKDINELIKKM